MNTTILSPFKRTVVGVQFLFVAFGATVLVPLLVGLDPATALFTAGIGTLPFVDHHSLLLHLFKKRQNSGECLEHWQVL